MKRFSLFILVALITLSLSVQAQTPVNGQRAGNILFVNSLPATCRPANGLVYGRLSNPIEYSICVANNTFQRIDNVTAGSVAPVIVQHSPAAISAGAGAFTLTLNGLNFAPGAVVNWNGSAKATTYVSSTQVTASILAGDIANAGAASVSVSTSGSTTNAVTVVISPATNLSKEVYNTTPTPLPARQTIELNDGLQAFDDLIGGVIRLKTEGVPTGYRNIVTDFGANPDPTYTTGTIAAASTALTVANTLNFKPGQYLDLVGAGASGGHHVARIVDINRTTKVITLDAAAVTAITNGEIRPDNWYPLQNAINTVSGKVYGPAGFYRIYNPLARQITFRAHGEGNPTVIEGAADGSTWFQFTGDGDGFVAPLDGVMESVTLRNFSMFVTSGAQATNKGWAINLGTASNVNYLKLENVRLSQWRGGLFCPNCQGGAIEKNVFRGNKHSQLVLASDETKWVSGMEPNGISLNANQFDFQPDPMTDTDTALTGLSASANGRVITAAAPVFVADHRGKIIRINGAGTTSGDIVGMILSVDSPTQVTITSKVNKVAAISGKTGTISRTPHSVAYFLRSNFTTFKNSIIQGNFGGSTLATSSVIVENTQAFKFENHYSEENGGSAGAHIKLVDTLNTLISGFKTNSQGACDGSKHCWDLLGTNAKGTKIEGASGSLSILHYNIDANSDVTVDHSTLGNPDFASETGPQRVTYGDNVNFAQWGDVNRGTATLYDATYGEQRVTNPRFDQGLTGWTVDTVGGVAAFSDGAGRYKNYAKINTTALATNSTVSILSQTVNIPDGEESAHYVLAFDYRVDSIPVGSDGNYKVEISVIPSAGGTGYNYPLDFRWQVRGDNSTGYPLGRWLRAQFNLKTASGTGRTFKIEIRARRGALTPIVSFANFRLMPGRHAAYSNDQPLTELKGGRIDSAAAITLASGAGGGVRTVCIDNNGTMNTFGCAGGSGGGALTLNGQSGINQSFAKTDDSNVTLTINSAADTHTFGLGWTGTLAKARQYAATVYADAGNVWSTGAQDFGAATSLKVPASAGAAPAAAALLAYDTTANAFKGGINGVSKTFLMTDGSGAALTNLNATQLLTGFVPLARITGLTNIEISPSAAIALNKLATLTAGRAVITDGAGVLSTSTVTSTELGHLAGVTAPIQTQLANRVTTVTGTANQVLVNGTAGSATTGALTLTLPQSIGTTNDVQFQRLATVYTDTVGNSYGLKAAMTLANSAPITGNLNTLQGLEFYDSSTNNRVSAQLFRFLYVRNASATGLPSGGDYMMNLVPVINSAYGSTLVGISIENNYGTATLDTLYKIRLFGGGSGAITNLYGVVVDPGSGKSGFGLTLPTAKLHSKAESATELGFKVEAHASSTVPAAEFSAPVNVAPIMYTNLNSSSANIGGTVKVQVVDAAGKVGVETLLPADRLAYNTYNNASPANGHSWFNGNVFGFREKGVSKSFPHIATITADFSVTSSTTLVDVSPASNGTLTFDVEFGRTYLIVGDVYTTSNNSGGIRFGLAGTANLSGGTNITAQVYQLSPVTVGADRVTGKFSVFGDVTAVTTANVKFSGTLIAASSGTIILQFAQNVPNATASTVKAGSTFGFIQVK